jgi:hypothetical protein
VCWYRAAGALVVLVGVHVSSLHVAAPTKILPKVWGRQKASNIPTETISK